MEKNAKLNVAILGSGNIGSDVLAKVIKSPILQCTCFIGRREDSPGISFARKHNIKTSVRGIHEIIFNPDICDIVFDATSALEHTKHVAVQPIISGCHVTLICTYHINFIFLQLIVA